MRLSQVAMPLVVYKDKFFIFKMAKFDKIAVLGKMGATGMVPVFYHKDAEVAKKVVKACYDGGVRALV